MIFFRGIGIKIKELSNGVYIPSFADLNTQKYFPQNLPSMLCAKILDPKPGQLILDMCAAPGGKTTHIAELIKNKAIFDTQKRSKFIIKIFLIGTNCCFR